MPCMRQKIQREDLMQELINGAALPTVAALSYIGDARHSLFVRRMLVKRGITKSGELNAAALAYVTAEAQAEAYLVIEPHLTDTERDVFRRAFNSTHLNKPKRAHGKDYRTATGFEAVIGMLDWLGDDGRIDMLLSLTVKENGGNENDTEN